MLVLPNILEKENLKLCKYTFLGSFFGNFSDNHTTVAVENKKIVICVEFWVDNVIFHSRTTKEDPPLQATNQTTGVPQPPLPGQLPNKHSRDSKNVYATKSTRRSELKPDKDILRLYNNGGLLDIL
jgi:hypothetical protein